MMIPVVWHVSPSKLWPVIIHVSNSCDAKFRELTVFSRRMLDATTLLPDSTGSMNLAAV
jgi:hypothetical protein